ncbi:uncharacterized protein LOC116619183 [Nematostella vectensis]|uniref:uncharacterized protein LOC116619183 n=1 Tax=Nematostella vectensis TaxID=45351 RepID=UPI0013903423|nr:uncharacterized protein LOC116619183 [Nematostella vectensis]
MSPSHIPFHSAERHSMSLPHARFYGMPSPYAYYPVFHHLPPSHLSTPGSASSGSDDSEESDKTRSQRRLLRGNEKTNEKYIKRIITKRLEKAEKEDLGSNDGVSDLMLDLQEKHPVEAYEKADYVSSLRPATARLKLTRS